MSRTRGWLLLMYIECVGLSATFVWLKYTRSSVAPILQNENIELWEKSIIYQSGTYKNCGLGLNLFLECNFQGNQCETGARPINGFLNTKGRKFGSIYRSVWFMDRRKRPLTYSTFDIVTIHHNGRLCLRRHCRPSRRSRHRRCIDSIDNNNNVNWAHGRIPHTRIVYMELDCVGR